MPVVVAMSTFYSFNRVREKHNGIVGMNDKRVDGANRMRLEAKEQLMEDADV